MAEDELKTITDAKIEKYLGLTARALDKVTLAGPEPSYVERIGKDFLNMATSYLSDARHFAEKGDYVNAFACVNYAHGWLDAAARLGLVHHGGDDQLFTLER